MRKKDRSMNSTLRILHLEDNPTDAALIYALLEDNGLHHSVTRVETRDDFSTTLENGGFDIILSDFALPSFNGLAALTIAHEMAPEIPFIFVSGTIGEDSAIESLLKGATDYVLKHKMTRLIPAIQRAIRESAERRERKKADESLRLFRALIDRSNDAFEVIEPGTLRFLDVNERACNELGYTREEFLALKISDVDDMMTPSSFVKIEKKLFEEGFATFESKHKRKDGSTFPVEVNLNLIRFEKNFVLAIVRDVSERKKAEEALQQEKILLHTLIDILPDAIYVKDAECRKIMSNPADLANMGAHSEAEVIGKTDRDFFPPEKAEKFLSNDRLVLQTGVPLLNEEDRLPDAEGEQRWLLTSKVPLKNEKGEIIGLVGSSRDITDRKRMEEALQTSEARLFHALTIARMGHWEYDVAEDVFIFNDNFYKIFHTTAEKEGGYTLSSSDYTKRFVHPDDAYVIAAEIQKAIETKDPHFARQLEHRFKYVDGGTGYVAVHFFAVKDDQGRTIRTYGVNQDITERKITEEEILRQTTYFRQLFENSPEGIVLFDEENRVVNVNDAFEKMFQYSLSEIKGKKTSEFIVPEEKMDEAKILIQDMSKSRPVIRDSVRKRKDQSRVDVLIIGYPIMIKDQHVGTYGLYVDISERKRLQSQLFHAQRMESIGTLAGGIAHDFNNILGIVMGHASLLRRMSSNQRMVVESSDAIDKAAHRGAGVVKQLLTFARKSEVVIQPLLVNTVIAEIVKLLRETFPRTITITANLDKNLPLIDGDPNQMHQVLLNFCVNARDAMPEGGTLTLKTTTVSGERVRERWSRADAQKYVVLSVSDTGTGMDEATQARIFEPFFTTKDRDKGTGLGLAVVFGIIESHSGFIDVESEQGAGATFTLYFPAKNDDERTITNGEINSSDVPGGTETIFIVEDEEMLRELLRMVLAGKGYNVIVAGDGIEAVNIFRERYSEIKLIICDFGLPKLDGYEVLKRTKEINPSVKVILASGYIEPEQKAKVMAEGAIEVIQKPYIPSEVMKKIRDALDAV
jgi:PAS domain S-box-containing protein